MKPTQLFAFAGGALLAMASTQQTAQAQIINGNAFMKGTYLEVGISQCGTFGTSAPAPTNGSYHNNEPTLGFVADANQDGWGAGSPNFCGDYFVPGTPEEGWNLKMNGIVYSNHNVCDENNIAGNITSFTNANGIVSAGWQGSANGLEVKKTTFFPQKALYFVTDVTLTNTTGATINNVYYMRNVDPDNEQPWTFDFSTINTVVSQASPSNNNVSLVKAVGLDYGCYLGLGTIDPRARVTHGGFGNRNAQEVYDGTNLNTSGTRTADESISLSFSLGSLAPGQSVCFSYAYILNEAQLGMALQATTQPVFRANGTDITASGAISTCQGNPVSLLIEGGNNYNWTWSPAAGLSTTTGSILVANPATTTTYEVTGISACGTFKKLITINVVPNTIAASVTTTGACGGLTNGTATAVVSGGQAPYQYSWSTNATSSSVSGLAQGQYTVAITDNAGCQATATGTVNNGPLNVTAQVTGNVTAPGADNGTATATATGGIAPYYYYWNTVPQLNEQNAFGLAPGTYTVTALDQSGCQGQATVTLSQPASMTAQITSGTVAGGNNIACAGATTGYATLTVTNGTSPYTYSWSNGATSQNLTSLAAGTYTVTVTDANGITATASVTLTQPSAALQVTGTVQTYANGYNVSCQNGSNGSISLHTTGGTAPYTIQWQGGGNTETIGNLSAGTHNVTVTDANGCEATASFTLTQPALVVADAGANSHMFYGYPTNQNGQYDPTAPQCVTLEGTATGGSGTYNYQWSNSANTASTQVCPTSTTTYTLKVEDSNGCQAIDYVTVDVTNVKCGTSNNPKVLVCHRGHSGGNTNWHNICISANAVQTHLDHGCYIGPCTGNMRTLEIDTKPVIELSAAPNPFKNTTSVNLHSSNAGHALVEVYDVNGRMVQTLYNGQIESDQEYEFEFNGEKLPAGLYMCRLVAGEETATLKLVLIK